MEGKWRGKCDSDTEQTASSTLLVRESGRINNINYW